MNYMRVCVCGSVMAAGHLSTHSQSKNKLVSQVEKTRWCRELNTHTTKMLYLALKGKPVFFVDSKSVTSLLSQPTWVMTFTLTIFRHFVKVMLNFIFQDVSKGRTESCVDEFISIHVYLSRISSSLVNFSFGQKMITDPKFIKFQLSRSLKK